MPLYEMTQTSFRAIEKPTFTELGVKERDDIQRLLRTQIDILSGDDELLVIAEEFSEWEDSKRRIDLLAIDRAGDLVIIELKRTHDGGHMELQAIRYASMVANMTFDRVEQIYSEFLPKVGKATSDARGELLAFLSWEAPDDERFARNTRILLVSEDFGKELTTTVLWLRKKDIDIRCVRLVPYRDGERTYVDVQQVIPLPEEQQYQVQLRAKEQVERRSEAEREEMLLRFWQGVVTLAKEKNTRHANIKPGMLHWMGASSGNRGLNLNYLLAKDTNSIELYIDRGNKDENKRIFDQLAQDRDRIDAAFGDPLSWERMEDRQASRIKWVMEGGYKSPESQWSAMQQRMFLQMTRLEAALQPSLSKLRF